MIRHSSATPQDLERFWGHAPPYTVQAAMTVLNDEEPIAIGGIAYQKGAVVLWMEWKEEALDHPLALVKAARGGLIKARAQGHRVLYAVADTPTAERFLKCVGLRPVGPGSQGGVVYRWLG